MLIFSPSLKPSTQKALSLAAYVKTVEKGCEHLRENLKRAEEEVSARAFFRTVALSFFFSPCLKHGGHLDACQPFVSAANVLDMHRNDNNN